MICNIKEIFEKVSEYRELIVGIVGGLNNIAFEMF
jgi:hypothetical protein